MIDKIQIKAFKSLLDVSIELGRINVFVGANGAGKSNIFEAIGVLSAAATGRVDDEALLRRGVRPGVPALYKSSFRGLRMRSSIRLEATCSELSYAVELNNPIHNPQPAWTYKAELLKKGKVTLAGRSPASHLQFDRQRGIVALKAVEFPPESNEAQLLKQLSDYAIYTPNTQTLRGLTPDQQQRDPVGLSGGRLPEAVFDMIRSTKSESIRKIVSDIRTLIDWQSGFGLANSKYGPPLSPSVSSPRTVLLFRDRFMADERDLITAYDASEGALYVLFVAVLAAARLSPAILAIDNMDQALNPRLARSLVSKLCEWILSTSDDRQVLLSSHNPLVLDGLPLENDDVRLFAVGRSRKGRTTVSRVFVDMDDLRRDGEIWTVSRLWVNGHLGGMPDV